VAVVAALVVVEQAHLTVVKTIEVVLEEIKLQVVLVEQLTCLAEHYILLVVAPAAAI
tara:strand:+ start:185 stop:355 length:171 start_codon:yes stop_codon:yes gene_type:complete